MGTVRCQCGLVHFDAPSSPPLEVYICHCTECRHQSASAWGISLFYTRGWFERAVRPVTDTMMKDQDVKVYERTTEAGRVKQCLFCSRCGCRLVHMTKGQEEKEGATVRYVLPGAKQATSLIGQSCKGGCLDSFSKEMMQNAVHIWTKSAVVEIPPEAKQFETEPVDRSDTS